ncbi:hypothetical protein K503DRAFT_771302 [Rhizopogon vinicolor AM-OR11-026]|uniref:Uncharacterized protein n=1 Tax=Rhizopogon vinicolor AM-OR11-026 TaxID=1314800 RepID=A0A1B7MYH2_9AGAM|nr:hypothetical protein K503DRAFT_771302 [Rhizopogon vinicolor AM-OR11-026]
MESSTASLYCFASCLGAEYQFNATRGARISASFNRSSILSLWTIRVRMIFSSHGYDDPPR